MSWTEFNGWYLAGIIVFVIVLALQKFWPGIMKAWKSYQDYKNRKKEGR